MDNVGVYAGLGTLGAIFLAGWISFRRKCKKEGKFYGEQQIRNPEELGDTEPDSGRDSKSTVGGDGGDVRGDTGGNNGGEPRASEIERRESVLGEDVARDETTKGDGERSNIQVEPIDIIATTNHQLNQIAIQVNSLNKTISKANKTKKKSQK